MRGAARKGGPYRDRNHKSGVPTLSRKRKATLRQRYRELPAGPARSENQGMYGTFMRENREGPFLPVRLVCGRAA